MPLFHKKSKSSLTISSPIQCVTENRSHMRKFSSSSTISQASSTSSSHTKPANYHPLSLHPPLSLNTSPNIIPEYDIERYRDDEERENRFFNQSEHAEDHIQDSVEYSPVKGKNFYFEKPYMYDQEQQWPLKDWQAVPPGLAEMDTPRGPSCSRPTVSRQRDTEWMNASDSFVKRGEWKRRGIVFHLDSEHEDDMEQHFELPESPESF